MYARHYSEARRQKYQQSLWLMRDFRQHVNSSEVSVGVTSCNPFVTGERSWHQDCETQRHDVDSADSFDFASAVGVSERRFTITCSIDMVDDGSAFDVCVLPHWDPSASTSERFEDAASAFEHHMELALMSRQAGWTAPRDSPHHAVAEA